MGLRITATYGRKEKDGKGDIIFGSKEYQTQNGIPRGRDSAYLFFVCLTPPDNVMSVLTHEK